MEGKLKRAKPEHAETIELKVFAPQRKKRKRRGYNITNGKVNSSDEQKHQETSTVDPSTHDHLAQKSKDKSTLAARKQQLLQTRSQLPIWPHADAIRSSLRGSRDVLLLVGETGSGKSTQVPQFLVSEPWCQRCIAITQPRRVAATSLARRVAEEMGTPLGSSSPASKVGYSVRFDNSTSPSTRIKFLTEGMLLQEMLRDPWLEQYSAVIVDEVHERSVNVDLILGFLRNIVCGDGKARKGSPLKTVVMSATADTEALFRFFEEGYGGPARKSDQGAAEVKSIDAESESSWSGLSEAEDEGTAELRREHAGQKSNATAKVNGVPDQTAIQTSPVSKIFIKGRQYPVETIYLPEPISDFAEETLKTIFQIHYKEPLPGDILVFLTGQDTVEAVETMVNEYAAAMGPDVPKILALPIFAALPRAAQQAVFQPTPSRTRKVVLATNIAETSVTIPGVRFVVDCGLAKVKEFRTQLGLDSLLVKPISKSAATQRQGRAGREAAGKCHRLYTERDYLKLQDNSLPEILRCDLALSLLIMKARGVDDVLGFPFLDRPDAEALRKALLQLHRLGALADDGSISKSGLQMARLPLSPPLARVLIAAAAPESDCVLEVVDIIACLTVENVFLNINTEEKKEEAEEARRELYRREGDHLTLMTTVRAYAAEQSDRKAWAERHFVSHRAMRNVLDVRKQLQAQCVQQRLLERDFDSDSKSPLTAEKAATVLKCFMEGFAANTARLMPDGSYRTLEGNQTVSIHPSSVLFGRKLEAILYNELVFTTKCYARGVSAVQLNWYTDVVAGE